MKPTVLTLSLALLVGTNTAYAKAVQTGVQAGTNIAVAQVQNAQIQGFIEEGVMTFKGVPYAKAERFMPPVCKRLSASWRLETAISACKPTKIRWRLFCFRADTLPKAMTA